MWRLWAKLFGWKYAMVKVVHHTGCTEWVRARVNKDANGREYVFILNYGAFAFLDEAVHTKLN